MEDDGEETSPSTVTMDDFDTYLKSYVGDKATLALLLDYDGTLSPIEKHPDLAILPSDTKKVLKRLSQMPDVFIAIVSGRNVDNVKHMVGIDGITYAGNHGLEIHHSDGNKFVHPKSLGLFEKAQEAKKRMEEAGLCQHGAWVENKGNVLTYHYRNVADELRGRLVEKAKQIIMESGFKVGIAHCALECKPEIEWDKGRASIYILQTAFGDEWSERVCVLFAGDDVTDEDAIKALKGMAYTFRIVSDHSTQTEADKRLSSTDSVFALLKWVERHMNKREKK